MCSESRDLCKYLEIHVSDKGPNILETVHDGDILAISPRKSYVAYLMPPLSLPVTFNDFEVGRLLLHLAISNTSGLKTQDRSGKYKDQKSGEGG